MDLTEESPDAANRWIAGLDRIDMAAAFVDAPPPLDLVLPGMLSGTVGALVSPGGLGKSWVALQMAIAVAGGPDLLRIGPGGVGPVVYVAAEDPALAIRHRLHALAPLIPGPEHREALVERLAIHPLYAKPFDVTEALMGTVLRRLLDGARLAVVDTLRRVHPLDENAASQMADLLGILEGVCHETGSAILLLHHTAKSATTGGTGDTQQATRGSSVLTDNLRGGQFNLVGMGQDEAAKFRVAPDARRDRVRLVQSKSNIGPLMPDRWLQRGQGGVLLPWEPEEAPAAVVAVGPQGRGRTGWRADAV